MQLAHQAVQTTPDLLKDITTLATDLPEDPMKPIERQMVDKIWCLWLKFLSEHMEKGHEEGKQSSMNVRTGWLARVPGSLR
eukprot:868899-Prorocentrum_lima.AAC.1